MKNIATLFLATFLLSGLATLAQAQEVSGRSNSLNVAFEAHKPEITWLSPSEFLSTSANTSVEVKAGIKSESPVADITLYVNDVEVSGDRGFGVVSQEDQGSYDETFVRNARLNPGDNNLKLVVVNEEGGQASSTRVINYTAPVVADHGIKTENRRDMALLFAIDEYDEWGDLTNPVFDATTIGEELKEYYGFDVEVITNVTKREMLTKLREYAKKNYLPTDQLFIFFAGHGQFDEVTRTGYLVAKDSKKFDEIKETYVSHSVLRDYVNNIPCDHIFLTMDACFGGTFDPLIAKAGSRGEEESFELTQTEFIKRKMRFKTRKFLTSGGKEYVPDGRPGAHSPFARKFLAALRNYGGRDKILTLTELNTYMERLEILPRFGEFGENEPGSDFIFIAR